MTLKIVEKSYEILEPNSERVYSTLTFYIQKNKKNRLKGKIQSIEDKIGKVN